MNYTEYLPGLKISNNLKERVLYVETWEDFLWSTLYTLLMTWAQYIIIGGILTLTHPAPLTEERKKNTKT